MNPALVIAAAAAAAFAWVASSPTRGASTPGGRGGGGRGHVFSFKGDRDFAALLPPVSGPERDAAILAAVRSGQYVRPSWFDIRAERAGRTVVFKTTSDALRVGSTRGGLRVNVSHRLAQAIADSLGLLLPTSRMSDLAWQTAAQPHVEPQRQTPDARMGDTSRMLDHSRAVDAAIAAAGIPPGSLVRTVGKEWITSERLREPDGRIARVRDEKQQPIPGTVAGCNFGWQTPASRSRSPGGVPCLQPPGIRHPIDHTDYSQVLCLYGPTCEVDGVERSVEEVLGSPDAWLLSDEVVEGQPCRVTRHPGLARVVA